MKAPTEVLSKPLEFKVKLAIGEDAYASLKTGRNLQKMVDALSVSLRVRRGVGYCVEYFRPVSGGSESLRRCCLL